jgi:type IV pilus assembly protein PilN
MPRINLLPWREAERKKRQRDFGVASGGAVLAAIAVIMLTMLAYSQMISDQRARNDRLTAEIVELEKSITEIDGLERQKERLLARMEIIEQLQKSRPEIVHLFDELVRQLPEGVYLTGMKQTGSQLEIRGVAQSSTRVSALMRQVDAQSGASRQAEFVLFVRQTRSGDEMEEME